MKIFPRQTAWLSLLAASSIGLLPACGGGDTTGSGGAGGGSGGTTTTDSTSSGGGGAGGTGGGSGGSSSGGNGGTGGVPANQPDGSACTLNDQCAGGFCLTQAGNGWPYGYCTGACNSLVACAEGSICIIVNSDPFCLETCVQDDTTCGQGQTCTDPGGGISVCFASCANDDECAGYGTCNEDSGFCVPPEDCAEPGDEDDDNHADCEDSDCAVTCQAELTAACGAAEIVNAVAGTAVMTSGDNSNGTELFAGNCSGTNNSEKIYQVVIPGDKEGILDLSVLSSTNMALYVRESCGASNEPVCKDAVNGGATPESGNVAVLKGQKIYVFVDGSSANGATGNNGSFTLSTLLLETVPEAAGDNNTKEMAGPVVLGAVPSVVTGTLDQVADNDDWFSVDTTALAITTTITAETVGFGGDQCGPLGDIDTYLEIVAEDGTVLDPENANSPGQNENVGQFSNTCSLGELSGAAPGKYFVHVRTSSACVPGAGVDCAFKYALKIQVK